MPGKLNCWEFKNCGREKSGLMVPILGECPVPGSMKFDGLNNGQGAGRACWMVDRAPLRLRAGRSTCSSRCCTCDFYKRVVFEQKENTRYKFTSITT
jgi:hypothetical protein